MTVPVLLPNLFLPLDISPSPILSYYLSILLLWVVVHLSNILSGTSRLPRVSRLPLRAVQDRLDLTSMDNNRCRHTSAMRTDNEEAIHLHHQNSQLDRLPMLMNLLCGGPASSLTSIEGSW